MIRRIFTTLLATVLLAGIGLALVIWAENPEKRELDDAARAEAPGGFLPLADGAVHYQAKGPEDGPPVVLVHGFSVPFYIWDTTFQALGNAGFRAIRFDTYGRGYSDRPNAVYDGALFDRQINGLLDGLGVDQPVDIIGLSMGGAVTARFVANNPERVRRIIFIDPTNESWGTPTLPRPIGDIMMALRLFPAIAEGQMSDFLYPEDYPAWVERYEVQMQFKGFRNAIVSTIYDFGPEDHLANFARIQPLNKQVLLIWGLQDQTVPVSGAETVQSVLDVEYLPIDDCGHLPHIEQADIVNPAIIKFLQK